MKAPTWSWHSSNTGASIAWIYNKTFFIYLVKLIKIPYVTASIISLYGPAPALVSTATSTLYVVAADSPGIVRIPSLSFPGTIQFSLPHLFAPFHTSLSSLLCLHCGGYSPLAPTGQ